jgi:hypothetical protein
VAIQTAVFETAKLDCHGPYTALVFDEVEEGRANPAGFCRPGLQDLTNQGAIKSGGKTLSSEARTQNPCAHLQSRQN